MKNKMNKAYLLLGGNMGNKQEQVHVALNHIKSLIGEIVLKSSIYETAPWGFEHKEHFLNQAILVHTELEPGVLMEKIIAIEVLMGRKRDEIKWKERIIDIDILFFNDKIIKEKELIIPHPFLQDRKFALIPLNEIAGEFIHPVFNKSIHKLLEQCPDKLDVIKSD